MAGTFQAHHLQPRTTVETQPKSNHDHHHGQNPAKIKSQQKPQSPSNHKSNHTHRNQSTKPIVRTRFDLDPTQEWIQAHVAQTMNL